VATGPSRVSFEPRASTRIYLLIGSLALSALLAEIFCRIANIGNPAIPVWEESRTNGARHAYVPNTGLIYRYPDNPRGYFNELNEVWGSINSSGFRGQERSIRKPASVRRIAFLGDSFTLGIGVRDVDTLPAQFERAMRQSESRVPGTGVRAPGLGARRHKRGPKQQQQLQVLNFGISDSSTPRQIELLEEQVLRFQPDVVILVLFLNDADLRGTSEFLRDGKTWAGLRQHSYFVNALIGSVEAARLHREMVEQYQSGYTDGRLGWETMKAAIRKGQALSVAEGFEWVVALYPVLFRLDERYPFEAAHRTIARFCQAAEIPFVDLLDSLRGQRDTDLWVHRTDQHPNELAHALAAAQLVDRVTPFQAMRSRR
jgi:lysophospholipase L1-like esterase